MTSAGETSTCHRCGATYEPQHRFCGACGAAVETGESPGAPPPAAERVAAPRAASERMDRLAGRPYPIEAGAGTPYAGQPDGALPYYISPNRIILLTAVTAGLYIFFWMYITWRHYRDHTGEAVYPICHALTLLVPVYQLFRLHAHMRVYQELMDGRGVPTTLRPLRAVSIYLAVVVLEMVALRIVAEPPITPPQQLAYFAVNVVQVGLLAWLMRQAQGNLNRFWRHRLGSQLGLMRLHPVELVLVLLGLFEWLGWFIILIDPSILPAEPPAAP